MGAGVTIPSGIQSVVTESGRSFRLAFHCVSISVFTAQCTLVHLRGLIGIACRLSVCPSVCPSIRPSVTLVICDHVG